MNCLPRSQPTWQDVRQKYSYFHSATSGAANDIENATAIARAMVTQYGMSDKFGMMCLATTENQYLDEPCRTDLRRGDRSDRLMEKFFPLLINVMMTQCSC